MGKYKIQTMQEDIKKIKGEKTSEEEGKLKEIPKPPEPKSEKPKTDKPTRRSMPEKPGKSIPSEPIADLPTVPSEKSVPDKDQSPKKPEPPKPPEPSTKELEQESPKPKSKIKFLPIVIVIIVILIAGGVYYWWNYLRAPESPEPAETNISQLISESESIQIIESLEITIPDNVSNKLSEQHTYFIHAQQQQTRAGLIVEIDNQENLETSLKDWEAEIISDLNPLFLNQKLDEPATENFQDNTYKNIDIRYMNFPDPGLTIDYAIVNDYLVITTSREGMYKLIDVISPP